MSRVLLKSNGTVMLGPRVSCDGFSSEAPVRVQTHIHQDHMLDFDTSKANQQILMSQQTLSLLRAMFDADLPYRANVSGHEVPGRIPLDGVVIELLPSRHILGGTQVAVEYPDGYRVGYSSDFFWPLSDVVQVDELLVDSTYGDPDRVRDYTQADVDERLLELVTNRLRSGRKVAVLGYNGRLQQAANLFCDTTIGPAVASPKCLRLFPVYEEYGLALPSVLSSESAAARRLFREPGPLLAFATLPERRHLPWLEGFKTVTLSAHMVGKREPLIEYPNGDANVAFTDHADFDGTLAYIERSGARTVWTDLRTGNAEALAEAVRLRLNVDCAVIAQDTSLAWG